MDYDALGQKIRATRKGKDWNIRELAEKAGLSEDYMGKIERGDGIASVETLVSIANALEIGLDTLVGKNLNVTEQHLISEINSVVSNMDASKRRRFLEFIQLTSSFFNEMD